MKDRDRNLLFEVYKKIYEAPVDPGGAWDTEDASAEFDSSEIDRLKKYQVPTPEIINDVVEGIKDFLASHENSHYDGTFKEFRIDIIHAIKDAAGIGSANAGYVARVVTNALKRLNIISVDGATQQVTISDVDETDVENEVEDEVVKVVVLQNNVKYEIGKESNATPGSDVHRAHEVLKRQIGAGFTADGRLIITALMRELSTVEAKALANKLLQTDAIFVPESEEDDEERIIDTGEEEVDNRYAADDYATKHFGNMGGGSMGDS